MDTPALRAYQGSSFGVFMAVSPVGLVGRLRSGGFLDRPYVRGSMQCSGVALQVALNLPETG
jgi:hypothetical protein